MVSVDPVGRTALHLAAWFGHNDIVKLLLAKGSKPDVLDNSGRTALHLAAWFGNVPALQELIGKGAPLNVQDKSGNTALHLACQNNHKEVVTILLNAGANTKLKNILGLTILNIAEADDKPEILEILQQKEGEDTKHRGLIVDKTMLHEQRSMQKTLDEITSAQEKRSQDIHMLREKLDAQGQRLISINTRQNELKRQIEEMEDVANQIAAKISELIPKKSSRFTMTHILK